MQSVLRKISIFGEIYRTTEMTLLKILFGVLTIVAGALGLRAQNNNVKHNVKTVDPTEFKAMVKADPDAVVLDVRRPDEFEAGHMPGARNINWLEPDVFKAEAQTIGKDKTLYVYCRSGRRSAEAANWLASKGYKVVDLRGGWLAWDRCCGIKEEGGCCK